MGSQYQHLTPPHAWGPEAVQIHSAWKPEAQHAVSRPGCSCPGGFRRPPRPGPMDVCGLGSQSMILTGTLPCALHSALRGDFCPAERSAPGASWDLTLTLTLPRTGTLQGNLSLPRTLTLHLSRLVAWALTSALEGDHETSVASALATSLSGTLTLAKAVSPWGPNSYVSQHLGPGVQKRCRLTRHGTWKLSMCFPRPGCSCPRGFRRPPRPGTHRRVWPWQPKYDPDRHPPLRPPLSPSGRLLPC